MDIFWAAYSPNNTNELLNSIDLAYYAPEPYYPLMAKSRKDHRILKCYAVTDYFKNIYVLRSPMDYSFTISDEGYVSSNDYDQKMFDTFVVPRSHQGSAYRTMSLTFGYTFFSTKSVKIEQLPLMLDYSELSDSIRIIPGTYDISKWIRPTEIAFEIKPGVKEISIKRGDPLCCIRFVTDEKTKLIRTTTTDELRKVVDACTGLKHLVPRQPLKKCYELGSFVVNGFLKNFKKCPFKRWR